jgi:ribosomal protein S18 acetylase RimI-like enzyme
VVTLAGNRYVDLNDAKLSFDVCRVGAGDARVFARLAPDVFDEAIEPARLAAYLDDASHLMVLALSGGVVIGQAAGVVHLHPDKPNELYVEEVGVSPLHQQRGVARAMLDELARWGIERGCEDAWLGTEPGNQAAKALYAHYARPENILMYYWEL